MPDPKPPRKRDRKAEYANRTPEQKKKYEDGRRRKRIAESIRDDDEDEAPPEQQQFEEMQAELRLLEKRTRGNPTDADGDIDFAYRKMALPNVSPLDAPSPSAWSWYVFARNDADEFLKICAKREDAKAKMAGTITNQRMEDDKRQQFAVLDRLKKELTLDVVAIVSELMEKFPDDVLRTCRKYDDAWKAFLAKEPQ